jgi:putative flippase GtrA
VGAVGIGVQLAALAALNAIKVNYLLATALAVETAILHNFLWHQRFTWADRGDSAQPAWSRFWRFHLSNGAISLVGNLMLMRWLAGSLRFPILLANVLTITACALTNFLVSDRWVFLTASPNSETCAHAVERSRISTSVRCAKGT